MAMQPPLIVLLLLGVLLESFQSPHSTYSKLSVHSGPYDGAATRQLVSAGQPRLIKLLDSFGNVESYKSLASNIVVIGRVYLAAQPQSGDPKEAAIQWWSQVNSIILSNPKVDYWEGYNEPAVSTLDQVKWYSEFEQHRLEILANNSLKAIIGCFAVGTPDVTNSTIIEAFLPAIAAGLQYKAWLGLHEYSAPHMWSEFNNSTGEGWLTGRYRRLYRNYLLPNGLNIPCVMTETGLEFGWKMYSPQQYMNELAWYDSLLREDTYVVGSTVFLIDGTADWDSFSVNGEVATLLTEYLQKTEM